MHLPTPNSDGAPEPVNVELRSLKEKTEIHSARSHRCVDKVRAKGHPESNSWAICTASMGKSAVYAKGHGGKAPPKKKIHESNDCHAPEDGKFCSGPGSKGKLRMEI